MQWLRTVALACAVARTAAVVVIDGTTPSCSLTTGEIGQLHAAKDYTGLAAAAPCVLYDTAATALDRHAREVERRRELIAHVERVVAGLVEEAVQTAADGGARVRELVVPPPGAPEWLDVDVRSVAAVLGREAA